MLMNSNPKLINSNNENYTGTAANHSPVKNGTKQTKEEFKKIN